MVKHSNEQTLGEIIKEVIKSYGLDRGITQVKITSIWEKVMGKFVAAKTTSIKLQKTTLIVELDSPALRNELSYAKEKIINSLNKELGKKAISELVIR